MILFWIPFSAAAPRAPSRKRLGRKFLGIEQDSDYVKLAKQRIRDVKSVDDPDLVNTPSKRAEPRIPFGWLIERGLLAPGDVLVDQKRRYAAKVRADGTLLSSDFKGSIHQVGAHVQKEPACNGWQFWYKEEKGDLVSINLYRQKLRTELN